MVLLDAHCHLELFIDVEKKIKKFPEQLNVITMTNTPKTCQICLKGCSKSTRQCFVNNDYFLIVFSCFPG